MNTTTASTLNGKKLYKVLSHDGASQNGGTMAWSLPEGDAPGTWHEVDAPPRLCTSGLHLTTEPTKWMEHGELATGKLESRIFEVEAEDFAVAPDGSILFHDGDNKCVAKRVRLMRELKTHDDLAAVGLFLSGEHELKGNRIGYAYGTSTATARDSSTVRAYGTSTVRAYDSSTVTAYGTSTATASGQAACHIPLKGRWGLGDNKGVKMTLEDDASCVDYRSNGKPKFHTRKSWGPKAAEAKAVA